jgi:hypothetical protein
MHHKNERRKQELSSRNRRKQRFGDSIMEELATEGDNVLVNYSTSRPGGRCGTTPFERTTAFKRMFSRLMKGSEESRRCAISQRKSLAKLQRDCHNAGLDYYGPFLASHGSIRKIIECRL